MFIASTDVDIFCSVLLPSLLSPLQHPAPTHAYQ